VDGGAGIASGGNVKRSLIILLGLIAAATLGAATAVANPITFQAQSGTLSASVTFEVSGTNLIVTLANTSSADVLVPVDVLTGVFFDATGLPGLTKVSAVLASGSTVLFGTTDPGNVVGGEWAYKSGLSGAPHGAGYGISSSGLGLFGPGDRFPGHDLQGPPSGSPGGLEYGVTSAADDPTTGNKPVKGTNALIKDSVVFTFSGLPTSCDLAGKISNVNFQYGTALTDTNLRTPPPPTVPEPGSLLLLGSGLLGLAAYAWHRK
jgi:hypothetical protein